MKYTKPIVKSILFIFCMILSYESLFAKKRNGVIYGLGLGTSLISHNQEILYYQNTVERDKKNIHGFAVDIIAGYAFTSRFHLYYINKESWFVDNKITGKRSIFVNSMGPFGASVYTHSEAPSLIFSAGMGFSHWYAPSEKDQEMDYGRAVFAGIGFEFYTHFSIHFEYMWSDTIREEDGTDVKTKSKVFMLTLRALRY